MDLGLINKADIVICTPNQWDQVSRKWRQRQLIQKVSLFIFDEIHMLAQNNSVYEVVISRTRLMVNELESKARIMALSTSLANSKEIANWLGVNF